MAEFRAFGEVSVPNHGKYTAQMPQIYVSSDFALASGEVFTPNLTKCPPTDV